MLYVREPCNPFISTLKDTELQEEKRDFCVCVKPLDFPNEPRLAKRLTEWIESNLQLGAQKIVIYVYSSKCIIVHLSPIPIITLLVEISKSALK